jgi:hypothetical protein
LTAAARDGRTFLRAGIEEGSAGDRTKEWHQRRRGKMLSEKTEELHELVARLWVMEIKCNVCHRVEDTQQLEPPAGPNGHEEEPTPASWSPRADAGECKARYLYEKVYCARGDMENRIKECQLDLYADRTSTATMRANQLRLWFASMAYVLLCALRRIGLHETEYAKATCGTIRLKLLKIGALVRVSVRRIKVAMATACPAAQVWGLAASRLIAAARPPPT